MRGVCLNVAAMTGSQEIPLLCNQSMHVQIFARDYSLAA